MSSYEVYSLTSVSTMATVKGKILVLSLFLVCACRFPFGELHIASHILIISSPTEVINVEELRIYMS